MSAEKEPDYINKDIRKVSEVYLKKVLSDLKAKHEKRRREDAQALNEALHSGFRCVPKHYKTP